MTESALRVRGPLVSAVLHGAAIGLMVLVAAEAPRVERVRLPGSAAGKHLLLTYSVGGQANPVASALPKRASHAVAAASKAVAKAAAAPVAPAPEVSEQGTGSAGLSALGAGNVKVAAPKVFPRPEPDLSSLAHGAGGNVILNAVIDAKGSITDLTVVEGLGDKVDQQVLATVRGWSFVPATRDGVAIASEQEIVLHYERG